MKDELFKHFYDVKEAASAIVRFVDGKTFDFFRLHKAEGCQRRSCRILDKPV
jgi:hypothetical protein